MLKITTNPFGKVARQEGIEPSTYGLEVRCSIHLSYWRKFGRGERIRTSDILLPKQARYQAALHPDKSALLAPDPTFCNTKLIFKKNEKPAKKARLLEKKWTGQSNALKLINNLPLFNHS